ncbi:MAG: hypothetical protein E6Q98_20265 [Rhodospirillaceae bacterium]|nr:MAG: hypothetical protein E6Q98_20265 [Rhodospirillaceae bacterium]
MRKTMAIILALGAITLVGGCASDTRGPGNILVDNNCSGNGYVTDNYCTETFHPVAGPYGTAYRDSRWHQFDDQAWLNLE